MAKRIATSDLNHTNWDQEEEAEDAGTFQKASQDVLQRRVFKTAKRRLLTSSVGGEGANKSVFGSFTGFAKSPKQSSQFDFLKMSKPAEATTTNGVASGSSSSEPAKPAGTSISKKDRKKQTKKDVYHANLKGLNQGVSAWIKKHVDVNPFVNLQPVFNDYTRYFEQIQVFLGPDNDSSDECPPAKKERKSTENASANGNVAETSNKTSTAPSTSSKQETGNLASVATTSKPTVTLTNAETSLPKPSTTASATSLSSAEEDKEAEEFGDEPPNVDFKPVLEYGHVFTIRCKLFIKSGGSYKDKGVGNLYIKPVPSTEKCQLLIRADTSLGNILCNFILAKNIPLQRVGEKDVVMICVPTPENQPPPIPIVIRVKSRPEADELFTELQKNKN